MAGQLIQKGERKWLIRIFKGRDANGKKHYYSRQINGNKKDAQKVLNSTLRDIDHGVFVEPTTMSLDDFLNEWLKVAATPRLSERTDVDYEYLLKSYVRPSLGSRRLSELQPLDIQKLYTNLQSRGLSARTVRYVHSVLSSALKQAVKWRMTMHNPAAFVELPKLVRKEMQAFTPEQALQFLKAVSEHRHGVLFAFALATGMRPEEFLAFQSKDLDLNTGIAVVQRVLIWRRKGGGWYYGEPKTTKSRRSIPLPPSILRALSEHRRKQIEGRLKGWSEMAR